MSESNEPKRASITLADFLESHAPGSAAVVSPIIERDSLHRRVMVNPDIQLHCGSDSCGGTRIFFSLSNPTPLDAKQGKRFMTYRCRNCGGSEKTYALLGQTDDDDSGVVYKIGEYPAYGPPVPARVITLIGPDRDLFLRGRRSENQGLGIGAFAYYRRVVENQWKRLVDEIIRVAEKIGAPSEMIATLKLAGAETRFSAAVDKMKGTIPSTIRINGHNPLTLLHSALSEGIHELPEDECLVLASSIRVILTELAERLGQALKDDTEVTEALSNLLSRKTKRTAVDKTTPETTE